MKTQNTRVEENRERREKPYRHLAVWMSCLGAIGVAVAANSAREARPVNPAPSNQAAVSASAPAEASAPLSSEFRPSSFPGVLVRAVPDQKAPVIPAKANARPDTTHSAASIYHLPGKPRKAASATNKSNAANSYGNTTGGTKFISRPGPGGSTLTRFDPAFAPRETVRVDARGAHFKCSANVDAANNHSASGQKRNSAMPKAVPTHK